MANAKRYYIAYGSNLNTEQMKMRCPDAQLIGTSAIGGCELMFKGSGTGAYLTIEPREGSSVPAAASSRKIPPPLKKRGAAVP